MGNDIRRATRPGFRDAIYDKCRGFSCAPLVDSDVMRQVTRNGLRPLWREIEAALTEAVNERRG